MERQIKVTDVFAECREAMVREIKEHLEFLKEQGEALPKNGDFIIELADTITPIYSNELKGTWFLHDKEIMQVVEPMGIPLHSLSEDKGKMQAICLYLEHFGQCWFDRNGADFWDSLE